MKIHNHPAYDACEILQHKKPGFKPLLGIMLGSGLGNIAEEIQEPVAVPYHELPGFPVSNVAGHENRLLMGYLAKVPVVCFQGRAHLYEGNPDNALKTMVRTLKLLGASIILMTNAAGTLHTDISPGQLMLISDHINLQGHNPLMGEVDNEFGERFVSMQDAYDQELGMLVHQAAAELDIPLTSGVYVSVSGPSYETPAEIKAFRHLGADAVGMSTVPEVILARHCGLRVVAVSAITNLAAGLAEETISHQGTLHYGHIASTDMARLILAFVKKIM